MLGSFFPRRREATRGKRVVFFAINKTGSSSLWTWLDQHGVDYLMNRYREEEARKLALIAEVKRNGVPCFTVVRNPWSRALSSWKWCMREKGLAPCSFDEFLRIPLERMTRGQRFHTLPQWRHVADADGEIGYLDHVGRFEALEKTRDWLAETLGLPGVDALAHLKRTGDSDYTKHYTPETRALVAEIFRRDIEMFGYEFGR